MKYIIRCIIIAALVVIPLSVLADEGGTGGAKDGVKSPWKDIKTAAKPIEPNIPKEYDDLVAVFSEYWKARKEADYKKAYELEGSEYTKATSFDLYKHQLSQRPVEIIAVRPLEVKPVSEKEVMVRAGFGFKAGLLDTVRFIQDRWVKEDKGWRHLPEEEKKG